jgi:hypothetical protein
MEKFRSAVWVTPTGIISYPQIVKPSENKFKGTMAYSCSLLIPKSEDLSSLKEAMKGVSHPDATKPLKANIKDGDTWANDDGVLKKEKNTEYAGHWVLTASIPEVTKKGQRNLVMVVNSANQELTPEQAADQIYGGAYCKLVIELLPWVMAGREGVALRLKGVQKVKEGEPFSRSINVKEYFKPIDPVEPTVSQDDELMGMLG